MSVNLDGPNDQRVIVDDKLVGCVESPDNCHRPRRHAKGWRCAWCAIELWYPVPPRTTADGGHPS